MSHGLRHLAWLISRESWQGERDAGWPTVHPEDYCQRCLNRNITWSVDSDRFNLAVEALGLTSGAVICIACFVEGHQIATGLRCAWQLLPLTHFSWPSPEEVAEETARESDPGPAWVTGGKI